MDKKTKYKSMIFSAAIAVFLTGVTEPLEFMFMFAAPALYFVYSILQGLAFASADIVHLRLHSFGNLELITRLPIAFKAGLGGDVLNFVIVCVVFFVVSYFIANFMIKKFNFATPGRKGNYENDTDTTLAETAAGSDTVGTTNSQVVEIVKLLGGKANITDVDACMTRLRVSVKEMDKVADTGLWKSAGAMGLLKKDGGVQAIYGPKADILKSDINDYLEQSE